MNCPMCEMRADLDDLRTKQEADRVALGKCWIEGGMLNHRPDPTTIRIDCPIREDHWKELNALLIKIEMPHDMENSETT